MKPNDLYKREPIEVTSDIWCLEEHLGDDIYDWEFNKIDHKKVGWIKIKYYQNYCFDGERTWSLGSVWFHDKPVMIIRNAGRGGQDHTSRLVTDEAVYLDMISYLKTCMHGQGTENLVDPDKDIPDLVSFYGCSLDREEDFKPYY